MSTLVTSLRKPDRSPMLHSAITAAGVAGTIGCAGYMSTIFVLSGLPSREAVRSPLTITSNLIVALSFAVLAVALPAMTASTRLPRWAAMAGGVGCVFVAANAWGTGTLAVHAARLLTDDQMDQGSVWFSLFQAPQSLPCAIGFIALAATGWRRRAMSRGACALLGLAGIVSLVPAYPPGALLAALALAWTARSARQPAI